MSNETRDSAPRRRYTVLGLLKLGLFTAGLVPATTAVALVYIHVYPRSGPVVPSAESEALRAREIALVASTGVSIRGWHVAGERPDSPLVVLVHGHGGNRTHLLPEARFLRDAGYAVGMPDLRAHGLSEQAPCSFGALEAIEVVDFTRRLMGETGATRVVFFGMSLGAVTALRAGTLLPESVAVIADSPFSSIEAMGKRRLALVAPGRAVPALWIAARALGASLTGVDPAVMEVTRWVNDLGSRPLFLIHTEEDGNIPSEHSRAIAAAYRGPVSLWISPGPGHVQTRQDRNGYRKRVLAFLAEALRGGEA